MEKIEVTILEPEAETMLDEMANRKLIKLRKPKGRSKKVDLNKFDERMSFYLSGPVMSDDEYETYKNTREWMNKWQSN